MLVVRDRAHENADIVFAGQGSTVDAGGTVVGDQRVFTIPFETQLEDDAARDAVKDTMDQRFVGTGFAPVRTEINPSELTVAFAWTRALICTLSRKPCRGC